MTAEPSGDYVSVPLPEGLEDTEPVLKAVAAMAIQGPPANQEALMTPEQHREQHGLCYRTDCVIRYGAPLVVEAYGQWTPHN